MSSLFALPSSPVGAMLVILLWWPIALLIVVLIAAYTAITQIGMQRELPQRKGLFMLLGAVVVMAGCARIALESVATVRGAGEDPYIAAAMSWLGFVLVIALGLMAILGIRRIVSRRRTMTEDEHRRFYASQHLKPEWLYWPGQTVPRREPQRLRELPLMRLYERRPKSTLAAVGAGLVLVTTAGSLSLAAVPTWAQDARVVRVVDGDTVVVRVGDHEEYVRILNMNAPEDNAVTGESECLGQEATAALEQFLPKGRSVTLAYDEVRRDRFGRLLAKVTTEDGVSAATVLIAQGLAAPAEYGDNMRFFAESTSAMADAEAVGAGIFSPSVECGPLAAIESLAAGAAEVTSPTDQLPSSELASAEAAAIAVLTTVPAAKAAANAIAWVTPDVRDRWLLEVTRIEAQMTTYRDDAMAFAPVAAAREAEADRQAAADAARQAEAERIAAEAEAARLAEEQRQAAAADADQQSDSGAASGGSGSTGGYDGYTGCRAYGPGGTSVDEQGRRYTKIDCTTKLPL
ncbi:thermonuclease family protein [Agromyces marinus]|uniref:TNase-like domain-containing protein n=1 Tax=Agromyces marinus TaxID=1389020 RepID=A0ABM8H3E4_9MICO|nr:thermonuclease family protein [Agromyces marinus]UIP59617.1 hypothetical protein DSM26151_25290 [Agromyces marinus]BDZ55321.1 hypothetical protein GCM10025870_23940 [Agromyces marinus]